MAIIYSWDCRTVDCYPTKDEQGVELDDVVYNIHWRLTGTEESGGKTYSATVIGTQMVTADDIDPATFVPFDGKNSYWFSNQCSAGYYIVTNGDLPNFIEGITPC